MEDRVLTEQEISQGYIKTEWNGYPNFECVHQFYVKKDGETAPFRCAYATLWEGKMKDHINTGNHPWGRPDGPFIPRESVVAERSTEKLSEY